jgi:CSLREA domain-containing protein
MVIGLLLTSNAWAQKAVYPVNSTLDQVDDVPGNGVCHTAAGKCTLRAAIMEANQATLGNHVDINVPAGTYTLTLDPSGADGDDSGDLNLTATGNPNIMINIIGAGAATTIIDANHLDRVLSVAGSRGATLSGLALRNGEIHPFGDGGGIDNAGSLAIADCIVSHNAAIEGGGILNNGYLTAIRVTLSYNDASIGGGILNLAYLRLSQSTLSANHAADGAGIGVLTATADTATVDSTRIIGNVASTGGGAIYIGNHALLMLDHSTLSGNQAIVGAGIYIDTDSSLDMTRSTVSNNAASTGGGILNFGTLYASNSTVSANSATENGGGICNDGTSNVYNSTIVFNEADSDFDEVGGGAGVYNRSGTTLNVRNSVIADNSVQVDHAFEDCAGTLNSYGRNKFSNPEYADQSHCTITQVGPGNFSPLDSRHELGPLQANGGPTLTHALVPPSDMIDGAEATMGCIDQGGPLTTDQRGYARIVGARCDIGAFEYSDVIFKNGFD